MAPALAILANTDNDVEPVVTSVQALAVTLRAIANERKGIILQVLLELGQRPVGTLVNGFLRPRKIERLDTTR